VGPADLQKLLAGLAPSNHPRLLTGWERGEDAALFDLGNGRAGILTVDFITPVVDDPASWGRIAGANSLSDVFAMGGRPLFALNVVAFPVHCEPLEMLGAVLRGGQEKVVEAGAVLAGGHSVEDEEPKYGLVVYGEVEQKDIWRVGGALPGDALILTKPLGTGVLTTAIKAGMADTESTAAGIAVMERLNDLPRHLDGALRRAVRAATDVTGFGLAGHLLDLLGDDRDAEIEIDALPRLPGVESWAAMGLLPAGAYRNRDLYGKRVERLSAASAEAAPELDLLFDPQTSGGLLLAVDPADAEALLAIAREKNSEVALIGRIREGTGRIRVLP
jgi:selenide,water dikinase